MVKVNAARAAAVVFLISSCCGTPDVVSNICKLYAGLVVPIPTLLFTESTTSVSVSTVSPPTVIALVVVFPLVVTEFRVSSSPIPWFTHLVPL